MLDFMDDQNEWKNDSSPPQLTCNPDDFEKYTGYQKPAASSVFSSITGEAVLIALGIVVAKIVLWYFYQAAESEGIDVSFL